MAGGYHIGQIQRTSLHFIFKVSWEILWEIRKNLASGAEQEASVTFPLRVSSFVSTPNPLLTWEPLPQSLEEPNICKKKKKKSPCFWEKPGMVSAICEEVWEPILTVLWSSQQDLRNPRGNFQVPVIEAESEAWGWKYLLFQWLGEWSGSSTLNLSCVD